MLEALLNTPLREVYAFIDSRFVARLAEAKLCTALLSSRFVAFSNDVIQVVDNTIFYLEKADDRGALIVHVAERRGLKPKTYDYVLVLRARPDDTTELHGEHYLKALKLGLIPRPKQTQGRTVAGWVLLAALGVGGCGAAIFMFPIFLATATVTIILSPIALLRTYWEGRRRQRHLESIVATLSREFGLTAQ